MLKDEQTRPLIYTLVKEALHEIAEQVWIENFLSYIHMRSYLLNNLFFLSIIMKESYTIDFKKERKLMI
jgi:hypothetical protein